MVGGGGERGGGREVGKGVGRGEGGEWVRLGSKLAGFVALCTYSMLQKLGEEPENKTT